MSGLKRMVTARLRGANPSTHASEPPSAAAPTPAATSAALPSPGLGSALARRKTARAAAAPVPAVPTTASAQALDVAVALSRSRISPSGSPIVPSGPFVFCTLPSARPVSVAQLLSKSKRVATVRKADAERESLVTALANARSRDVLNMVVSRYAPYALTLHDISARLRASGVRVAQGIVWTSFLGGGKDAFEGGLGLEAAFVLVLLGVGKVRDVLEGGHAFGMAPDPELVAQIRELQAAAGVFAYVRDSLAPGVLADFQGVPPAEIMPDAAAMLYALSLALAQALHVRRAAMNGMSNALLTKLSAAVAEKAGEAVEKGDAVEKAGAKLCDGVKVAARDLYTLARGWTFQYHGLGMPVEQDAGGKVAALKTAVECLTQAGKSQVVGKVAGVDLVSLKKELEDATGENKIVYQHAIPKAADLEIPPGRSLANPTAYDAPRIQAGESASQ